MTHAEKLDFLRRASETISPRETAAILGGNAYSYNLAAKEGRLSLPHIWRGRNLRILTAPLLELLTRKGDCP